MNPNFSEEQMLEVLKNSLSLTQVLTVTGAKQAAVLATLGDNIAALINFINAKKAAKSAELAQAQPCETNLCNGENKEQAAH